MHLTLTFNFQSADLAAEERNHLSGPRKLLGDDAATIRNARVYRLDARVEV
jgi:hypothetical protein